MNLILIIHEWVVIKEKAKVLQRMQWQPVGEIQEVKFSCRLHR